MANNPVAVAACEHSHLRPANMIDLGLDYLRIKMWAGPTLIANGLTLAANGLANIALDPE